MFARTLATAIGLMMAIVTSQLPEFAQQYSQRLGGAIDELQRVIVAFDSDAQNSQMTRSQALTRMAASAEEMQRRQAASIAGHIARLRTLEGERDALRSAGPVKRLAVFASQSDRAVARRTLNDFEPALPTTVEGAVAAGAGFLAAWGVIRLTGWMFGRADLVSLFSP